MRPPSTRMRGAVSGQPGRPGTGLAERCAVHATKPTAAAFRVLSVLALLFGVTSGGCSPSILGRAHAPDNFEDPVARSMPGPVPVEEGPTATVHVVSPVDAVLVRLDDAQRVVDRCPVPCDRSMPLGATYRIDGADIRSTWPFRLDGGPNARVVLTVSPRLRSHYRTGKTLGTVAMVLMGLSLADLLVTAMVATNDADANAGGPAPCPACTATSVGGLVVGAAGIGLGVAGLVVTLSNYSSSTSEEGGEGRRLNAPSSAGDDARLSSPQLPWPNAAESAVVRFSF
jgi:hypothetical protein